MNPYLSKKEKETKKNLTISVRPTIVNRSRFGHGN